LSRSSIEEVTGVVPVVGTEHDRLRLSACGPISASGHALGVTRSAGGHRTDDQAVAALHQARPLK
jgi:hypothetical protein